MKFFGVALMSIALLAGCSTNASEMRMLEIYVEEDKTPYADIRQVTNNENTVVVDNESNMRVFLYGSSSCPPVVERLISNEKEAFLYIEDYSTYEDKACTDDLTVYPQTLTHVNIGNFETLEKISVCTTDKDCRAIENLIFNRRV